MRLFFFFNDTATTEIYTLSLHDALPILHQGVAAEVDAEREHARRLPVLEHGAHDGRQQAAHRSWAPRSEEHTSELQSRQYLVCRLLLEKKNRTLETHKLHL